MARPAVSPVVVNRPILAAAKHLPVTPRPVILLVVPVLGPERAGGVGWPALGIDPRGQGEVAALQVQDAGPVHRHIIVPREEQRLAVSGDAALAGPGASAPVADGVVPKAGRIFKAIRACGFVQRQLEDGSAVVGLHRIFGEHPVEDHHLVDAT